MSSAAPCTDRPIADLRPRPDDPLARVEYLDTMRCRRRQSMAQLRVLRELAAEVTGVPMEPTIDDERPSVVDLRDGLCPHLPGCSAEECPLVIAMNERKMSRPATPADTAMAAFRRRARDLAAFPRPWVVLLLDDGANTRARTAVALQQAGIRVVVAGRLADAQGTDLLSMGVVVLDTQLPDGEWGEYATEVPRQIPVVLYATAASVDTATQGVADRLGVVVVEKATGDFDAMLEAEARLVGVVSKLLRGGRPLADTVPEGLPH